MGQQQLLLLVLSVIIVGIAIVVGITMFNDQSASANLDAVCNDLTNLASRAQQYAIRPEAMGGGGGDFDNLTIQHLTSDPTNGNGTFALLSAGGNLASIQGTGTLDGDNDGNPCQATVSVNIDSIVSMIVNNR
ncbi:MAG: hypothetical protein C4524_02585 [Candidatus Zixiibacteriota bacterium]|nr:MAG: hypothetical protein C4524_02585 [candidate division Zixibacteria bacterium]